MVFCSHPINPPAHPSEDEIVTKSSDKGLVKPKIKKTEVLTTIWLGSLPPESCQAELYKVFQVFGKISELYVNRNNKSISGDITAFVCYEERNSAVSALGLVSDGKVRVCGRVISCAWAKKNSVRGARKVQEVVATRQALEPLFPPQSQFPSRWATLEEQPQPLVEKYETSETLEDPRVDQPQHQPTLPVQVAASEEGHASTDFLTPPPTPPLEGQIHTDGIRTLWVGGLPFLTTENDLQNWFHEDQFRVEMLRMINANSAFVRFPTSWEALEVYHLGNHRHLSINKSGGKLLFRWANSDERVLNRPALLDVLHTKWQTVGTH